MSEKTYYSLVTFSVFNYRKGSELSIDPDYPETLWVQEKPEFYKLPKGEATIKKVQVWDYENNKLQEEEEDVILLAEDCLLISNIAATGGIDFEISNTGLEYVFEGWQETICEIAREQYNYKDYYGIKEVITLWKYIVNTTYDYYDGVQEDVRIEYVGVLEQNHLEQLAKIIENGHNEESTEGTKKRILSQ